MKTFKKFILESGTGAGSLSGAAAQEAGEKRAEELRKKFNTILDKKPGVRTQTKTKKVYVTPKDKKKPENKNYTNKIKTLAKASTKTKSSLPAKPKEISGTPERKALPPKK